MEGKLILTRTRSGNFPKRAMIGDLQKCRVQIKELKGQNTAMTVEPLV